MIPGKTNDYDYLIKTLYIINNNDHIIINSIVSVFLGM